MQQLDFEHDVDRWHNNKKNVAETSKESYKETIEDSFELSKRYLEYLKTLFKLDVPSTDQEVTKSAGKSDPNYFRPRRFELADVDPQTRRFNNPLIAEGEPRTCKITGKKAKTWRLTTKGITYLRINGGI
jgi:hypothetical protein